MLLFTLGVGNVWGWNVGSDWIFYFDMQNCQDFGNPWLRIGRDGNNNNYSAAWTMDRVEGTKWLYYKQPGSWDNYGAFSVANKDGWTAANTIYQPYNDNGTVKPNDDHNITKQTNFQKYEFSTNKNCYLKITDNGNNTNSCQYYKVNNHTNNDDGGELVELPMYSVTFNGSPTHGTVSVQKYTKTDGSAKSSISTGEEVYPTQIIEITTTPDTHYALATLTVTGATHISGTTYYVTGACEITATFDHKWTIKGSDSFDSDDDDDEMGDWKVFNGLPNTGTNTYSGTISLAAHTAYYFKVYDRAHSTYYGCGTRHNDYTFVGQTDAISLESPGYNLLVMTTQAGAYTFEWNDNDHTLKVTYPNTVSHPSVDYVYMEKYSDWNSGYHCYLHPFYNDGGSGETMTTWGSDNPKMTAYTHIGNKDYYCCPILTTYPNFIAKNNLGNSSDGHETSKMYTSGHGGQLVYWKDVSDGWTWGTFTVRIQLNDLSATTAVDPTYQDIAFNSAVLTDLTSVPAKTHYDFGGFYTDYDSENSIATGTQVIDAEGKWIAGVADYTDEDKHWIHAGTSTTLYAMWTEHPYSITLAVEPNHVESSDPATGGTIQINGNTETSVNAHYVSETAEITAVPSSPAYRFKEWRFSGTDPDYDVYVSPGHSYISTSNPITIKAQRNGTLTAVFEPKFYLVGVKYSTDAAGGGMPEWESGSEYRAPFIVTSTSLLTATCTRELDPNTTFKFLIRNRDNGNSYGYATSATYITDQSLLMDTQDGHVYITTKGHGDYTFTISAVTEIGGVSCPTVSVRGPNSYQVTLKRAYVKITGDWYKNVDDTGGSVSARTTESGHNFDITDGQYVAEGGSITYTATPATGYSFGGWWNGNWESKITEENPHISSSIRAAEDFKAKFDEKTTTVALNNDGHGHVTIAGNTETGTTCGVTTTRELTAVPNDGYMFSSWSNSGADITITSTSTNPTTLRGRGAGSASDQTVTANFTERWSIKGTMNGEKWDQDHIITNIGRNASSKDTGYVEISLPANTTYQFAIKDLANDEVWYKNGYDKVYDMTYTGDHKNWKFRPDLTHNCGIVTAGAGTYRFIFNITDTTVTVIYPTSYLVNLGMKAFSYEGTEISGISCTVTATDLASVNYTNGQYIAKDATVSVEATSIPTGYHFVGWHNNSSYNSQFSNTNPTASWTVTEAVNAYAKITEDAIAFTDASNDHKWSTTSNWSGGEIPTINEVAIIQKPVVVDITDAKAKRVILDQYSHTGSLEIPAGKELIVAETVKKYDGSSYGATDEDDIFIGSNSTNGLGALVMGNHNNGNKATISFYSKASYDAETPAKSVNQYVGLPFTSGTVLGCFYDSWVYEITYPNNVPTWSRISGSMNPWIGYSIIYNGSAGHSYWMDGTLVATTNTTCSSLHNADATGASNWNNENLLANSWTAPIKINAMQAGDFTNTTATIYIFNSGSPNDYKDADKTGSGAAQYSTYTIGTAGESDIIPSMQSFSVFTTEADASVALNYERLVYTPAVDAENPTTPAANKAPQRRTSAEEANKLRLFVQTESGYGDMVYMWERSDFSEGFENGWDGHKLFGEPVAPQLYAVTPDGNMAVNCVPDFEGTLLGFQAGTSDNVYTFTFEYTDEAEELYLRDMDNNTYTRVLTGNSYPFTTTDRDIHNRFILTKNAPQSPTDITETGDKLPVTGARKFIKDDMLYIFKDGKLYNATGMLVE